MENITINDIFYILLTAVVPFVIRYLHQLASAKARVIASGKYTDAVSAVFTAVEFVNQTFVDSLKESGCFDNEAQATALEKAKTAALDIMDASVRSWLEKSHDDIDAWLTAQIEHAVKAVK